MKNILLNNKNKLPKTAIIGATGYLGSKFFSEYRKAYPDIIGTSKDTIHCAESDLSSLNLLSPNISPLRLAETGHKQAIIFASISRLAACEQSKDLSRNVNIKGILELARQLVNEGIKPIFPSSDTVFSGNEGDYSDDALTNPVNEYGMQKAEVEAQMNDVCSSNYMIIRLSKVFGLTKGDGTLLDEMAMTLASGKVVNASYDQIFCPILISDLIQVVAILQSRYLTGVVNVCGPEAWSRYDLAVATATAMDIDLKKVHKTAINDLNLGSVRPKNTSMKSDRLKKETGFKFKPIEESFFQVAQNWKNA